MYMFVHLKTEYMVYCMYLKPLCPPCPSQYVCWWSSSPSFYGDSPLNTLLCYHFKLLISKQLVFLSGCLFHHSMPDWTENMWTQTAGKCHFSNGWRRKSHSTQQNTEKRLCMQMHTLMVHCCRPKYGSTGILDIFLNAHAGIKHKLTYTMCASGHADEFHCCKHSKTHIKLPSSKLKWKNVFSKLKACIKKQFHYKMTLNNPLSQQFWPCYRMCTDCSVPFVKLSLNHALNESVR